MNTVILTGRATKEAEVRQMGQYTVAKFTLAVDRPFKKDKEKKSDFFKVECWGKQAEKAARIVKGIKVFVSGSLQLNTWDDKNTGQKRYEVIVVANEVEPVWGAESNFTPAEPMPGEQIPAEMVGAVDNQTEVPF